MPKKNMEKNEVNLSIQEVVKQKEVISEKSKPETNDEQPSKGSFVIKSISKDKNLTVLSETSIEDLIKAYPMLGKIDGIKKLKVPLLVISECAETEIKKHVMWDKKTNENVYEQGGILIGKPYMVNSQIVGIVEHIIPAEVNNSSPVYLKMSTETWVKMLNIYDEQYKEDGLFVIGWFHTHPNSLSVFMSSTDIKTQHAFFNQEWHFSVVLNPHRKLIACFNSYKANKCNYYPIDFTK